MGFLLGKLLCRNSFTWLDWHRLALHSEANVCKPCNPDLIDISVIKIVADNDMQEGWSNCLH